jgi:drug/metabolite transporter (DMT)-like permease
MIITAVILAVIAALCLALGTHFQQHAVATMAPGLRRRATWVTGLGLMGLVTVLNVVALGLGPVAIVQPIGAVSLVFAALIGRRFFGLRLGAPLLISIAVTLFGVFSFVATSAGYSHDIITTDQSVTWLLAVLIALCLFAGLFSISSAGHIPRVVMTGIVFGTVAAATHVLSRSVIVAGLPGLDALGLRWWVLLGAVGLASAAGFWLVQTAYACGPAETVLAGLTVIDPIVAVIIGAAFFGEYAGLTPLAVVGLLVAAGIGIGGVWMLARFHPKVLDTAGPAHDTAPAVTSTTTQEGITL